MRSWCNSTTIVKCSDVWLRLLVATAEAYLALHHCNSRLLRSNIQCLTKPGHFYVYYNFGKCRPIFVFFFTVKFLNELRRSQNKNYHLSSNLLLHHLAKCRCAAVQFNIHIRDDHLLMSVLKKGFCLISPVLRAPSSKEPAKSITPDPFPGRMLLRRTIAFVCPLSYRVFHLSVFVFSRTSACCACRARCCASISICLTLTTI